MSDPNWTLLVVVAILTGPSYGIAALVALLWFWKRASNRQPEIHVHYDKLPPNATKEE